MIEIHPDIRNIYRCPRCNQLLSLDRFIINGMQNLIEGWCEQCRHRYYADMPAGLGLYYPITIDADTYEVFDPVGLTWFSNYLLKAVRNKDNSEVKLKITRLIHRKECVLLNCLDVCYGDCLCKLFNAQYYIDNFPHLGCCVLIPSQLRHLVPDSVSEVWEVDSPIKDLWRWYISLEEQIGTEIRKKDKCYLSITYPHPHATLFSVDRFVKKATTDLSELRSPVIVFVYREDRLWGRFKREQAANIRRLYQSLTRRYPGLSFVLIGFGSSGGFPPAAEIVDKRITRFDPSLEQYWLDLLRATDCVVGVHGSGMIIPTGLAKCAIELLPSWKLGNIFQDYLVNPEINDITEALYRFRVIYGNDTLSDVTPQTVANVLISQLDGWPFFRDFMGRAWQTRDPSNLVVDSVPVTEHFRRFKHVPRTRRRSMWKRLVKRIPGAVPAIRYLRSRI